MSKRVHASAQRQKHNCSRCHKHRRRIRLSILLRNLAAEKRFDAKKFESICGDPATKQLVDCSSTRFVVDA